MPHVYFAKFNFNEDIYKIYNDESIFEEYILNVYHNLTTELILNDGDKNYKFIHLNKEVDKMVINGRVVSYSPGVNIEYDPENDDIKEEHLEHKASYVTFSFDLRREIIGFVPKRDFGRVQFIDRFRNLVERSCDVGEIAIFFENDIARLSEKLKRIQTVQEIDSDLIPPNNDKELFESITGINSNELEETRATRFKFNLRGTLKKGIDVSSNFVSRLIKATNLGYARIKAKGKNSSNEDVLVDSQKDALYRRSISNNSKDVIPVVEEKTRAGVTHLSSLKTERLVRYNEENRGGRT